jgi:hypothetical protein
MAALTTESANRVWQKVKNYLSAVNQVTTNKGASPASQGAFLDLKFYLSQDKRNFDLQFAPIDGVLASSDGGAADQVLASGALTLYGIYLVKVGATESIFKGSNHATVAGTDGTQDLAIAATVAGDVFEIYPDGRAESLGLTVGSFTTRTGSTRTLKANLINGFAILGA